MKIDFEPIEFEPIEFEPIDFEPVEMTTKEKIEAIRQRQKATPYQDTTDWDAMNTPVQPPVEPPVRINAHIANSAPEVTDTLQFDASGMPTGNWNGYTPKVLKVRYPYKVSDFLADVKLINQARKTLVEDDKRSWQEIGAETFNRAKTGYKTIASLGGLIGDLVPWEKLPEGLRKALDYNPMLSTTEELEGDAEKLSGFGPATVPATAKSVQSALEWVYLYPVAFKGAEKIVEGGSKIPIVARAAKYINSLGGVQAVKTQFPRTFEGVRSAVRAAEAGALVGGGKGTVEAYAQRMPLEEALPYIAQEVGTMATVTGVFRAASDIDKRKYLADLTKAMQSRLQAELDAIDPTGRTTGNKGADRTTLMRLRNAREYGDKFIRETVAAEEARLFNTEGRGMYGGKQAGSARQAAEQFMQKGTAAIGKTAFPKAPEHLRGPELRSWYEVQRAKTNKMLASSNPEVRRKGQEIDRWLQGQIEAQKATPGKTEAEVRQIEKMKGNQTAETRFQSAKEVIGKKTPPTSQPTGQTAARPIPTAPQAPNAVPVNVERPVPVPIKPVNKVPEQIAPSSSLPPDAPGLAASPSAAPVEGVDIQTQIADTPSMAQGEASRDIAPQENASGKGEIDVESKEFSDKFAKSSVVTTYGDPKPVFHGTNAEFDTFDAGMSGSSTKHASAKLGIFFTESEKDAAGFGSNVKKAYLVIENPKSYSNTEFEEILDGMGGDWRDLFDNQKAARKFAKLQKKLIAEGYDGIIIKPQSQSGYPELNNTNYVVFSKNQIISSFNPPATAQGGETTADTQVLSGGKLLDSLTENKNPRTRKASIHPEGVKVGDTLVHKKGGYTGIVDKVYANGRVDISVIKVNNKPEYKSWQEVIDENGKFPTTFHGETGLKVLDYFETTETPKPAERKMTYTNAPAEWFKIERLSDFGKGLRLPKGSTPLPAGMSTKKKRLSFVWADQFDKIPVRLENKAVMKAARQMTDEVVKVKNFKGDDYYLAPKPVVEQLKKQFGDQWNKQRPAPTPSPLQRLYYGLNALKAKKLSDEEIGAYIVYTAEESNIPLEKLSEKALEYVQEYRNAEQARIIEPISESQSGDRQADAGQLSASDKERADERWAIQHEDELEEIGGFLDGIVDEAPATPQQPKTEADLLGRPELKGGASGSQREMFDRENFKTIQEQERVNAKNDIKGQTSFLPHSKQGGFVDLEGPAKTAKQVIEVSRKIARRLGLTGKLKDAIKSPLSIGEMVTQAVEYVTAPVSFSLEKINPMLSQGIRRHSFDVIMNTHRTMQRLEGLFRSQRIFGGMSTADEDSFFESIYRRDFDGARKVADKNGFAKEFDDTRKYLDESYQKGLDNGLSTKYRSDYWPQRIKDQKGLIKYLYEDQKNRSIIEDARNNFFETRNRMPTEREMEDILNVLVRGYKTNGVFLAKPGFSKTRRIEYVDSDLRKFYYDPIQSLRLYIVDLETTVANNKFFGRVNQEYRKLKQQESLYRNRVAKYEQTARERRLTEAETALADNAEAALDSVMKDIRDKGYDQPLEPKTAGRMLMELMNSGKIKPGQDTQVQKLLRSYFNPGRMNDLLRVFMSMNYMFKLGNSLFLHNVTQLPETGLSYLEDWKSATKEVYGAFTGKSDLKAKDLPFVQHIGEEFQELALDQLVTKVLGTSMYVDKPGKVALVKTAISRARRLAKLPKPPKAFIDRLKLYHGEDWNAVLNELASGQVTDDVLFYGFSRLSDRQPLTKAEQSRFALEHPNIGRPVMMFKTFSLRRLYGVFNDARRDFKEGRKVKGMRDMAIAIAVLFSLDLSADIVKDLYRSWLAGRKPKEISEIALNTAARQTFVSRYQIERMKWESPIDVGWQSLSPSSPIDDIFRSWQKGEATPILRSVPAFGQELYNLSLRPDDSGRQPIPRQAVPRQSVQRRAVPRRATPRRSK